MKMSKSERKRLKQWEPLRVKDVVSREARDELTIERFNESPIHWGLHWNKFEGGFAHFWPATGRINLPQAGAHGKSFVFERSLDEYLNGTAREVEFVSSNTPTKEKKAISDVTITLPAERWQRIVKLLRANKGNKTADEIERQLQTPW